MASRPFTTAAIAAGVAALALLAPRASSAQEPMSITSTSFGAGQAIPARFTCEGEGSSPELTWSNVPQSAQSLALVVRDPDASDAGFVHWLVYDIPVTSGGHVVATAELAGTYARSNRRGGAGTYARSNR